MKKIIASILIAASIALYAEAKTENKETDKKISETLNTAGEGIKTGTDKAVNGVKNLFGKTKEKVNEDSTAKAKEKTNEVGQKIGDKIKSGVEKTEEAIKTHSAKSLTGTLKVKGSGTKTTATLKADDGKSYTLKTVSGSEDSMLKLSAYNKKKIKITGILNTETNEITLTTYKLASEKE